MSGDPFRHLIERYLSEVDEALGDLPPARRREILDDLRAHIRDALAAITDPNEAAVRSILDRLGTPDQLARKARERIGIVDSLPEPETARRPGIFETIAVVATAIIWPIGLVLVWISDRWRTRDKVIAAAVPVLGFAFAMLMLIPASFGVVTGTAFAPQATPVALLTPAATAGLILLLGSLFGTPFLSAVYLADQLRRPEERRHLTAS